MPGSFHALSWFFKPAVKVYRVQQSYATVLARFNENSGASLLREFDVERTALQGDSFSLKSRGRVYAGNDFSGRLQVILKPLEDNETIVETRLLANPSLQIGFFVSIAYGLVLMHRFLRQQADIIYFFCGISLLAGLPAFLVWLNERNAQTLRHKFEEYLRKQFKTAETQVLIEYEDD